MDNQYTFTKHVPMSSPSIVNGLGLPVGIPIKDWCSPEKPDDHSLDGTYCRLEPLDSAKHGEHLFKANKLDQQDRIWVYLPYGPFAKLDQYLSWVDTVCSKDDPKFYAIVDYKRQQAVGVASYLRIDPPNGSIEVGHINFSPLLQNSIAATEAMFIMMQNAFNLGYRRYEWKCDVLNQRSRNAAARLGFQFEGIFRQATIYKGRNRDTAWFSIIDRDWPQLQLVYNTWLSPQNFNAKGQQKKSLSKLTKEKLIDSNE
jgi:RimJ/RimL family protein N-acetyltransferase